jgi:prepilin-type N-terminal cleavage/methylation domain-containing protein
MRVGPSNAGFTLIELILVMTILTIAVAVAAPRLSGFFRGRTLDSEARRLLALTRQGQSRAVSEGVPMELWFDTSRGAFGLEAEPSYEPSDPRAIEFTVDSDLSLTLGDLNSSVAAALPSILVPTTGASTPRVLSNRPNLPRIRFLPDGSIGHQSPQLLRVTGRDGGMLFLALATNRYELRTRNN